MKRKNWALITGAIRNDFYLRIVIVKLCDMRAKGQIEGIILSTWDNEIDAYPGLKEELKKCGVILVETPYIDESAERRFNDLAFARQNTSVNKGLDIIPDDCFVLKLRTDFLGGIKDLLNYIYSDRAELTIKSYGSFKAIYSYKLIVTAFNTRHIKYYNDRVFFGHKQDLKKIFAPYQFSKYSRFSRHTDAELLSSYAFQSIPVLRSIYDILPITFFDELIAYCNGRSDADLNLPKIIYRVYAAVCVYAYTHESFALDIRKNPDDEIKTESLISLFQNKIRDGYGLSNIVFGRLHPTQAAHDFMDELRKFSLGLPEANVYTFEEYCELKEFILKELNGPEFIAEYPFVDQINKNIIKITTRESADVLLSKYRNEDIITEATSNLESFNSVATFLSNEKYAGDTSGIGIEILKAAVYDRGSDHGSGADRHYRTLFEYSMAVKNDNTKYDDYTWQQEHRNLSFAFGSAKLQSLVLAAFYVFLEVSGALSSGNSKLIDLYFGLVDDFQNQSYGRITGFKFEHDLTQHTKFLAQLSAFLHQRATDEKMTDNESEIIKALLLISPKVCPFSSAVIEKVQNNGLTDIYSQIVERYRQP